MSKPATPPVSLEKLIRLFRDWVTPSLNPKTARVETLLESFFAFYRETRVQGASLDDEGDTLTLEWGANCPHLIEGFMDFRDAGDDEVDFDEAEYEWIGLTRQVFVGAGEYDDDAAVGLCLFIYFSPADETDDDAGDSLSVTTPGELPAKLKQFRQNPYVAKLLKHKPSKLTAFVSAIG